MRIALAFQVFFRALFDASFASRVSGLLDSPAAESPAKEASAPSALQKTAKKPAARSDALTLLATLQREARLVDMIREPLGDYSDAQVGAAARDVLRDCGQVVDRLFGLQPLAEQAEGAEVEVPAGFDAGRIRLTGNVDGSPPYRGRLVHHGWIATRCEVPTWSGNDEARLVVAPEEVELA
jgi:hypothetical protein